MGYQWDTNGERQFKFSTLVFKWKQPWSGLFSPVAALLGVCHHCAPTPSQVVILKHSLPFLISEHLLRKFPLLSLSPSPPREIQSSLQCLAQMLSTHGAFSNTSSTALSTGLSPSYVTDHKLYPLQFIAVFSLAQHLTYPSYSTILQGMHINLHYYLQY